MTYDYTFYSVFFFLTTYLKLLKCRMDGGAWTPASRNQYNLRDAVSRCTTQVIYPIAMFKKVNFTPGNERKN